MQEEAARERLEERKRRQALFLHKKRRPRKVERKASIASLSDMDLLPARSTYVSHFRKTEECPNISS